MSTPPFDCRLDALLAAASTVFAKKGYHWTSMRYLAETSAMSRSTPSNTVSPRKLADHFTGPFLRGLILATPATVTHGG
jgi:hypothetical protein